MLLSFSDVSFSYNHKKEVLKNISFQIETGEKVALVGLNGSGKSTLLLHTNGLLVPTKGKVTVKGLTTDSKASSLEIKKTVGMVFQNPDDQLFMPTVYDDVAFGPRNMRLPEDEVARRVENALQQTGTLSLIRRQPYELSGGEKKSVSIATVLSMQPELLVLDEPTSGLDYKSTHNLIEILQHLEQAALISTHDFEFAHLVCSRVIMLEQGKIIYDGDFSGLNMPFQGQKRG